MPDRGRFSSVTLACSHPKIADPELDICFHNVGISSLDPARLGENRTVFYQRLYDLNDVSIFNYNV